MEISNAPARLARHLALAFVVSATGVQAQGSVAIGFANVIEGGDGQLTPLNLPILRSGDVTRAISVGFRAGVPFGAAATPGIDVDAFDLRPRMVIPANVRLAAFPLRVRGDSIPEAEESVAIDIANAFEIGPPDFLSSRSYATGLQPVSVSIGDLDGDGKPDVAASNGGASTLTVLRNIGVGTDLEFQSDLVLINGASATEVLITDLDGDGKSDLVALNGGVGTVSFYRNVSSGGAIAFAPRIDVIAPEGRSLKVADIDGDGRPDLVYASPATRSFTVVPMLSSPGAIVAGVPVSVNTGLESMAIDVGRLDENATPDLASVNVDGSVTALLNGSTPGAIQLTATPVGSADRPGSIVIADFDRDGFYDIATSAIGSNLYVFENLGDRSGALMFDRTFHFAQTSTATTLLAADFDGDLAPDLAVVDNGSFSVRVLRNTIEGPGLEPFTFAASQQTNTGNNPVSGVAGDLNGDSLPDLVTANRSGTITTIKNASVAGQIRLPQRAELVLQSSATVAMTHDFDGDGLADIAFAGQGGSFSVFRNSSRPGGDFALGGRIDLAGSGGYNAAVGDIDGDGAEDILLVDLSTNTLSVLRNLSGAAGIGFGQKVDFPVAAAPTWVTTCDLDADGDLDVAIADTGASSITVYQNFSRAGAFDLRNRLDLAVGVNPSVVNCGDMDRDGRPDLTIADLSGAALTLYRNTTTPGDRISLVTQGVVVIGSFGPASQLLEDFDGDGRLDVVFGDARGSIYAVPNTSPGPGLFTFGLPIVVSGTFAVSLAKADVNGDGLIDVVAVNNIAAGGLSVFENRSTTGAIAFAAPRLVDTRGRSGFLAINDVNGDGLPDVVVPNVETGGGSVILGNAVAVPIGGTGGLGLIYDDDRVTAPTPFTFPSQVDVEVGSLVVSDPVTIGGINFATPIAVADGEYSLNGGAFTTAAGSVQPGDVLRLRHTASLMFSTSTTTGVAVGNVYATFVSTTQARDDTPDVFSFPARTNVPIGALVESGPILVTGINVPSQLFALDGEYSLDGVTYLTGSTMVEEGDTVRVRHRAATTSATTVTTVLQIGGVQGRFNSTTVVIDNAPDGFSFAPQTSVTPSSVRESAVVTLTGIDTAVDVTVTSGEYRINSGAYTSAPGTAVVGDTLQVRHVASAQFSTPLSTTLRVGTFSTSFTSTTAAADGAPDAPVFSARTNVPVGSVQDSDAVTLAGFNMPVPISVSGGQYRLNGGAFTTAAATARPGDVVVMRVPAAAGVATKSAATLSVGTTSALFSVTTALESPGGGGGGGGGGSMGLTLLLPLLLAAAARRRKADGQGGAP